MYTMTGPAEVSGLKAMMAHFLQSNGKFQLRTCDILQKDEWKAFDDMVIDVARSRLVAVEDLRGRGLVRDLGGLGVTIDEWQDMSDMSAANVDMSGVTEGEHDQVEFDTQGVPVPIFHKDFYINIRRLLASRRNGQSIDTTQAEVAARRVADAIEGALMNGVSVKAGGYTLQGYTNYTYNVDVTISGDWETTPANITADVELMLASADSNYYYGPFVLYVPTAFWSKLRATANSYVNETYLQRLLQYAEISDVRHAATLSDDNVIMVQLTRDVVDLAIGQDITTVEWATKGGFVQNNKVMAAVAPRLKKNDNGTSGIFHGAKSF